jgi:hypothetical protein
MSNLSRGTSGNNQPVRDIRRNYGASPDDYVLSQCHTRQNNGSRPNEYISADLRFAGDDSPRPNMHTVLHHTVVVNLGPRIYDYGPTQPNG